MPGPLALALFPDYAYLADCADGAIAVRALSSAGSFLAILEDGTLTLFPSSDELRPSAATEAVLVGLMERLGYYVRRISPALEELLDMHPESFFSQERFLANGVSSRRVTHTRHGVMNASQYDYAAPRRPGRRPRPHACSTMREFLRLYDDFSHLTQVEGFGPHAQAAVRLVAREAGLPLPPSWQD